MQACPNRPKGLPFFISSLYNYLLDIIQSGILPQGLSERIEADSDENSVTGIGGNDVMWVMAPTLQGLPVITAAVYCLYCLYFAQPGPLQVRIRVSRENHDAILGKICFPC